MNLLLEAEAEWRRAEGRDDEQAGWAVAELQTAAMAYGRALDAGGRGELLTVLAYLRLMAEIGMRLTWILLGVQYEEAAAHVVRHRIQQMRRADLEHLRSAQGDIYRAARDAPDRTIIDKAIAQIRVPPAPKQYLSLAEESDPRLGGLHRMCSALIHAGAAIGHAERLDPRKSLDSARLACAIVVVLASAALDQLIGSSRDSPPPVAASVGQVAPRQPVRARKNIALTICRRGMRAREPRRPGGSNRSDTPDHCSSVS